jgi:hypothetical protein
MPEHPQRPQKPARPYPLAGDDNSDWHAWWNACDACRHSAPRGCMRGGEVVYSSGVTLPLAWRVRGGCADWEPRDA